MRVAIFNYESPESLRVRKLLLNRLEEETAITYDERQPDVVITIGGDGTLISAFHHYEDRLSTIRFVGIHTGHLGFYTDWRNFEVEDLVESLQNDSGQSVSYPLLEMSATYDDGEIERRVALNESTLRNIVKYTSIISCLSVFAVMDWSFQHRLDQRPIINQLAAQFWIRALSVSSWVRWPR